MNRPQAPALTLAGNIDRKTFRRFALYDALIRKKGWRRPALFAAIMTGFALVCYAGRAAHDQAVLLGSVLLGVGLVLPLVWLGMFDASVRRQGKRSGLAADKAQYYVTLSDAGIHVRKGQEEADFPWEGAAFARRTRDCLTLYVTASRALLLPECGKSDAAWALIREKLPPENCRDAR